MAVLVTVALVFFMAGALAVATSATLSEEATQPRFNDDLNRVNAITAAIAQVLGNAGSPSLCRSAPLAATLLPLQGQQPRYGGTPFVSRPLCARMDNVSVSPTLLKVSWSPSLPSCTVVQLPNQHLFFWFSARGPTRAWIDNLSSGCVVSGSKSAKQACVALLPAGVGQVAKECDLSSMPGTSYLHVTNANPVPEPVVLRYGAYDSSAGGSLYLLAAPTGGTGQYEEADLWVSGDGTTARLLFEGVLP